MVQLPYQRFKNRIDNIDNIDKLMIELFSIIDIMYFEKNYNNTDFETIVSALKRAGYICSRINKLN